MANLPDGIPTAVLARRELGVAHVLRKYNPAEWGGTETAVQRLLDGLRSHRVRSVVFCPRLDPPVADDPLARSGHAVRRYRARVPVWRIPPEQKRQLVSVGGNIVSFDLIPALWKEDHVSLIHAHSHNRLGGIALSLARWRGVPFVLTVHGGILDLPAATREYLSQPLKGGIEWGKLFGLLFRSRRVLEEADAIFTCNRKEARLLQARYPRSRIVAQPHSVPSRVYRRDHREAARAAFPAICNRRVLLSVGRIDPVKNQAWLLEQAPEFLGKFPDALLVLAGAATDAAYFKNLKQTIRGTCLERHVLLTGGLPPGDPRLIGLFQEAEVVVVPSFHETFGLVLIEAWASGTAVISSRTSGAADLITDGENGWMFDLDQPGGFHHALAVALSRPDLRRCMAEAGRKLVETSYDVEVLGGQVRKIYEELIKEKNALRRNSRR